MKLEDLISEKPSFILSNGKEYVLRIPNLEDRVEMVRLCGGHDQIMKVFEEKRWSDICKIVYRLLIDKSEFMASKETQINDEGFEKEVIITGPIKLLRAIKSQSEAIQMLTALTNAISEGEPLVREYVKNEVKKNLELQNLIGENSSISSPPSTATLPTNSELLPTGSCL